MELPMSTLQRADIAPAENNTNINKEKDPETNGKAAPSCGAISTLKNGSIPQIILTVVVVIAVHLWAVLACIHDIEKAVPLLIVVGVCWTFVLAQLLSPLRETSFALTVHHALDKIRNYRWTGPIFLGMFDIGVVAFLIIDTSADRSRLLGLVGMASFILLLVLMSNNRSKINWRTVTWGYSVQFFFGLLVLRWPWGSLVFQRAADLTVKFLQLTDLGSSFVYGYLAKPLPICEMEPVLAFSALQVLVFFGAVVSLLYYYSIIQWILKRMASFTQLTLGTTAVESLNACACVFLGQAESALLFGPYVEKQTASELHAIMTSGFSCIAGSLFAAYVSFGACPRYLLSSTVMSAPGSLACAKIMFPETEDSLSRKVSDLTLPPSNEKNPLECVSNGSMAGFHLVVAIAVNLVSVLALLGLVNAVVFYLGDVIGYETWSVENGLQYLVFPLAYIMGVSGNTSETLEVAGLISTKTVVNEFVAYRKLGEIIANNRLSARSAMIATYALCGFSNFCSVGIVLAVLGGLAPSKRQILARTIFRALVCGCICCLYTAAVAGVLVSEPLLCRPSEMASKCFNLTAAVSNTSVL